MSRRFKPERALGWGVVRHASVALGQDASGHRRLWLYISQASTRNPLVTHTSVGLGYTEIAYDLTLRKQYLSEV